jgi:biotin transport system substrate-specific component
MVLADAILPSVDINNRALVIARNLALVVAFAAFVALFAQIQVRLPWTTVPITGQTFAVLVTGGALGMARGAGALSLYTVAGMIGMPVFTPASSATSGTWDLHFVFPWVGNEGAIWEITTGGFLVGFIIAAAFVGYLAERGWDRGARVQVVMLGAMLLIYVPGLLWFYHLIESGWVHPVGRPLAEIIPGSDSLNKTMAGALYPFIVGDLMKLMLASMVLPSAWALVERLKGKSKTE